MVMTPITKYTQPLLMNPHCVGTSRRPAPSQLRATWLRPAISDGHPVRRALLGSG